MRVRWCFVSVLRVCVGDLHMLLPCFLCVFTAYILPGMCFHGLRVSMIFVFDDDLRVDLCVSNDFYVCS